MPRKSWQRIIEDTAKESVKAFYVLHRVRSKALQIGPWSGRMRNKQNKAGVLNTRSSVFDADDPGRACNRKRMMCEAAAGGRWSLIDRASGVLVPDKQSKGESGTERMEDARRGTPFVLTEQVDLGVLFRVLL